MTTQAKLAIATAALVIAAIFAYLIIHTRNEQNATQAQLEALRAQIAASTQPAPLQTRPAPTLAHAPGTDVPNGSALAREKAVQDYLTEGSRLLASHDPQDARKAALIYQEGLDRVDAANVRFLEGLGRAQLQAGKPEEALQAFTRGHALDPRRPALASGLGWACWSLKRYPESKGAWEDAIHLDPECEDAWSALAWVYMALGDYEKSQAGFVILLKKDPERRAWIIGLTMARAHNSDISQIRAQFMGMPDPAAFSAPASRPAP